jgi:hypothetical protein
VLADHEIPHDTDNHKHHECDDSGRLRHAVLLAEGWSHYTPTVMPKQRLSASTISETPLIAGFTTARSTYESHITASEAACRQFKAGTRFQPALANISPSQKIKPTSSSTIKAVGLRRRTQRGTFSLVRRNDCRLLTSIFLIESKGNFPDDGDVTAEGRGLTIFLISFHMVDFSTCVPCGPSPSSLRHLWRRRRKWQSKIVEAIFFKISEPQPTPRAIARNGECAGPAYLHGVGWGVGKSFGTFSARTPVFRRGFMARNPITL